MIDISSPNNFSLKQPNPLSPSFPYPESGFRSEDIKNQTFGILFKFIVHLLPFISIVRVHFQVLCFFMNSNIWDGVLFVFFWGFFESKAEIFQLVIDSGKFNRNAGKLARYHDDMRRFGFALNFHWKKTKAN